MLNSAETRLSATQDTLTAVRTTEVPKARKSGFKWGFVSGGVLTLIVAALVR